MILPFSTQINGKPTHFVEKIWKGIKDKMSEGIYQNAIKGKTHEELITQYPIDGNVYDKVKPKLHTIREDKTDRWKEGNKIDFFINCRQPTMFRFAPVLPVVSTQKIHVMYRSGNVFFADHMYSADVYVDKRKLSVSELETLSQNDGFDTVEDFFAYFNKDFTGKIIHWTDLRY